MRAVLLFSVLASLACAGPSAADEYWDSYSSALDTFHNGSAEPGKWVTDAGLKAIQGIEGKWVELSALLPLGGNESNEALVGKACDQIFHDARQMPYGFVLARRNAKRPDEVLEQRYSLAYGNVFGLSTDAEAMIAYFGLDKPDVPQQTRLSVLRTANGTVEVFRPSNDIFAVKELGGPARIFGRCR